MQCSIPPVANEKKGEEIVSGAIESAAEFKINYNYGYYTQE